MLDREQLETFARVAEEQSFDKAAPLLNVSKGAVSQRVKALEESLGTVLLRRDKPITPTPAGEKLLRYVNSLRMHEASVVREIVPEPEQEAPVALAIAVNADSLATWFPQALWEILLQRRVALEVVAEDQEHTALRLSRGEVVGCISTKQEPDVGFQAEALGQMEYRCYASVDFAKQFFPHGLTLESAIAAPAVLFNKKDSLHEDFFMARFGVHVHRFTRHYLPSPLTLLEGIAVGVGYGLIPQRQASPMAIAGTLVDLAPGTPVQVPLYWHHWEDEPPATRQITQTVVAHATRALTPFTSQGGASADQLAT